MSNRVLASGDAVATCGPLFAATSEQWLESLRDGRQVLIRPLEPKDRLLEAAFLRGLSPQRQRERFLGEFREPSPALLDSLMNTDGVRSLALIALAVGPDGLYEVGVARYGATDILGQCESAVVVGDAWQDQGLAEILMRHLIEKARDHGLHRMVSVDAASNESMRELARHLGFHRKADPDDPTQVIHTFDL